MCKDCPNRISCAMTNDYDEAFKFLSDPTVWEITRLDDLPGYIMRAATYHLMPADSFHLSYRLYDGDGRRAFMGFTYDVQMFKDCGLLRNVLYVMESYKITGYEAECEAELEKAVMSG